MKKKNLYKLVKQSLKEVLQEQRRDRRLGPDDFFVDPQTGELTPKDLVGAPTNTTATTTLAPDPVKTKDIGSFDVIDPTDNPTNPISSDGVTCDQLTDYGDMTGTLFLLNPDPTPSTFAPDPCNPITIDQSFICCSILNDNPNQLENNVQLAPGFFGANPLSSIAAGNACYLIDPTQQSTFSPSDVINYLNQVGISAPDFDGFIDEDTGIGSSFSENCPGCTYQGAENHYPAATVDDASCIFEDCTTEGFDNYFCTNPVFSPLCENNQPNTSLFASLTDDGSCVYDGCLTGISPNDEINSSNYVCLTLGGTLCDGTDPTSIIDTSLGTFNDDGSCIFLGCTDNDPNTNGGVALNYQEDANQDNGLCEYVIEGCTDANAANYDPNANTDDGTFCEYIACGDTNALNYNPAFILDDNTYTDQTVQNAALCDYSGCMDSTAANFSIDAVLDTSLYADETEQNNTLCQFPGCLDQNAINYDDQAILDNNPDNDNTIYNNAAEQNAIFCQYSGCMDDTAGTNTDVNGNGLYLALNYDPDAILDSNTYADVEEQNTALCSYTGCTDEAANNYDEQATIDDGSCDYDVDDDGVLDADEIVGCQDPTADNYNEFATNPGEVGNFTAQDYFDGGCIYTIEGCTDTNSDNYLDPATLTLPQTADNTTIQNTQAGTANDPCLLPPGCTDPNATNYVGDDDVAFTTDNGSCIFAGCLNDLANNYIGSIVSDIVGYNGITPTDNPTSFQDDGSCTFDYCSDSDYGNYVCVVEPSLCTDPTQGGLQCASACPNGEFNPTLGTINTDINLCEVVTEYCPDELAFNYTNPTTLSEQVTVNTANTAMCKYRYCDEDTAYNYSGVRPDGQPWNNDDIGDDGLCEFVGCADSTLAGGIYESTNPSTIYTNTGGLEIYYYHDNNSGCEMDPQAAIDPNSLEPTNNLSLTDYSCCPNAGIFGCTDNGGTTNNGTGILFGQQEWQATPDPSSGVTDSYATQTGIQAYPFSTPGAYNPNATIGAINYNSDAQIDDGTCEYNIGCYDPDAFNGDSSNQLDTQPDSSCKYCKDIVAVQCNPDPDENGYAQNYIDMFGSLEEQIDIDSLNKFKEPQPPKPSKSNFKHTITRVCATIGGETPQVGDEFLAQGIQYTSAGTGIVSGVNQVLPINEVEDVEIDPNTAIDDLEFETCCCPGGLPGSPSFTANAALPGGCASIGCSSGACDEGTTGIVPTVYDSGKPGKTNITAVFRVESISNPTSNNNVNFQPWQCSKRPPSSGLGIDFGKPIDVKPYEGPKLKINEIEISKKLRKSLTEMFKNKK